LEVFASDSLLPKKEHQMKSAAIIDFTAHRNQENSSSNSEQNTVVSELGIAIQTLIQQMRESNPLKPEKDGTYQ
jgi:hypothetical protein